MLINDDFGSIVEGIKQGRLIFENLKKTISYVLSSNIPEIIPFLLFIAMKIPLGLETIMILFIDVGTDLVPAVALAYEDPEEAIMRMKPRTKDTHLVTWSTMSIAYLFIGMFETFASFFAWCYVYYDYGFTIKSLIGSGINYTTNWNDLPDYDNNERKRFFTSLCNDNLYY